MTEGRLLRLQHGLQQVATVCAMDYPADTSLLAVGEGGL